MAVSTTKYNTYQLYAGASTAGKRQIDHAQSAAGSFRCMLHASAFTKDNDQSVKSQLDNEVSFTNYDAGGEPLVNITFTVAASGTATFDADDITVTAQGEDISAAFATIVWESGGVTDATRPAMFWIDFGQTEVAGDTTTFNIQWNADGIVQIK